MERSGVSVCIPVGPDAWYQDWLDECLESVRVQTLPAADVILIDDMAGLDAERFANDWPSVRIWCCPWRLGIPATPNIGVALAKTSLVFNLSCDDKLKPDCLEMCWEEWERRQDPLGYYWVGVEYSTGETQALPCGHALIPKALWRHTGGWPVEAAVGACDAAFVSAMLAHAHEPNKMGTLYPVAKGRPLYWHRNHDKQYTKHQNVHPSTILDVRDGFTKRWKPPEWGRYEP